ncbi:MAG TPA: hypothetical protein VL243_02925 [Vicinamibacterales bacterium]|nr:hypothetical protein [Vicinamibacterales bacterium]
MLRAPRQTLSEAIARPQPLRLAVLILSISAVCSVGFLMTRVGRLAGLDQQVRQLESMGTVVTDSLYAQLRAWQPYRPLLSAGAILLGWPVAWAAGAALILAVGRQADVTFAQVFSVLVHASSVFALRAVVAAPINYARESLGGATSLGVIVPGLGDATFAARLFGSIDIFALWWVALVAIGLGMLYRRRAASIARWLLGAYATGAAALALTQALRGGV